MSHRLMAIAFLSLLWASPTRLPADEAAFTVLSPATELVHLDRLCSRAGPGRVSGGWNPTAQQIAQAEQALPPFVRANRRPKEPVGESFRQYVGVVISGKRLIYLNAFPRWLVERRELAG